MTVERRRLVRRRSCRAPLVAWMVLLVSCASGDDPVPERRTKERPFTRCPQILLDVLPPAFVRSASELKALPRRHMGEIVTYRDASRVLKTYSGVDAEEQLEDLDFDASSFSAGAYTFRLLRTENNPELRLATIEGQPVPAPCDEFAVLSRGLSDGELGRVLAGLRLEAAR